jgi:hypothetical protein
MEGVEEMENVERDIFFLNGKYLLKIYERMFMKHNNSLFIIYNL